jgi:hypothetical protein
MPVHVAHTESPFRDATSSLTHKSGESRGLQKNPRATFRILSLFFCAVTLSHCCEAGVVTFPTLELTITGPGTQWIDEWGDDPIQTVPNVIKKIQPIRSTKMVRVNKKEDSPPPKWGKLEFDPAFFDFFVHNPLPRLTLVDQPRGQATIGDSSVLRIFDDYSFVFNDLEASANGANIAIASEEIRNFAVLKADNKALAARKIDVSGFFQLPMNAPAITGNLEIEINIFGKRVFKNFRPGDQLADFVIHTHVPADDRGPFPFGVPLPFNSFSEDEASFGVKLTAASSVPEPSVWGLAMVGLFVGAGFVMRRRKLTPGEEWARARLS